MQKRQHSHAAFWLRFLIGLCRFGCLFLGLLAYWIVNTIRYQLKQSDVNHYWTEIVRIMRTQKAVTSTAMNSLGEKVEYRMCTKPTEKVKEIYQKLKYEPTPFKKMKICRIQT